MKTNFKVRQPRCVCKHEYNVIVVKTSSLFASADIQILAITTTCFEPF